MTQPTAPEGNNRDLGTIKTQKDAHKSITIDVMELSTREEADYLSFIITLADASFVRTWKAY